MRILKWDMFFKRLACVGVLFAALAAAVIFYETDRIRQSERNELTSLQIVHAALDAPQSVYTPLPDGTDFSNRPPVNINTASADELDLLPGIGSVLAQNIIDYRRDKGPFSSIEQVMEVSGIGYGKFEQFMDYITVDGQE